MSTAPFIMSDALKAAIDRPIVDLPMAKVNGNGQSQWWATLCGLVDVCLQILSARAVVVWLVLLRKSQRDRTVSIGIAEIETLTGIGERQVRRCLEELHDKGLIEVAERGGFRGIKRQSVTKYRLLPTGLSWQANQGRSGQSCQPEQRQECPEASLDADRNVRLGISNGSNADRNVRLGGHADKNVHPSQEEKSTNDSPLGAAVAVAGGVAS